MNPHAVRDGKTFHTRTSCPVYRRWWWRMQGLVTTSGLRKCSFCEDIEKEKR